MRYWHAWVCLSFFALHGACASKTATPVIVSSKDPARTNPATGTSISTATNNGESGASKSPTFVSSCRFPKLSETLMSCTELHGAVKVPEYCTSLESVDMWELSSEPCPAAQVRERCSEALKEPYIGSTIRYAIYDSAASDYTCKKNWNLEPEPAS